MDFWSTTRADGGQGSFFGALPNLDHRRFGGRFVAIGPADPGGWGFGRTVWADGRVFHHHQDDGWQQFSHFWVDCNQLGNGVLCFGNLLGGPPGRSNNRAGHRTNLLKNQKSQSKGNAAGQPDCFMGSTRTVDSAENQSVDLVTST